MTRAGKLLEAVKPSLKKLIEQSDVSVHVKNIKKLDDAVNFGAADEFFTNDYAFFVEIRPTFLSVIELKDMFAQKTDCKAFMLQLKKRSQVNNKNQDAKLLRDEIAKMVASGELTNIKDLLKTKDSQAFGDHLEVVHEEVESNELLAEIKYDLGLGDVPQY